MQERRRHVRVETPVLIEFSHPEAKTLVRSFTQDVSESGIRFSTDVNCQIGQEISLTLRLPFDNSAMKATGEVIWIRQIARLGGSQFEVGMRFLWVEDPDRKMLVRHLVGLLTQDIGDQ